MTNQHAPELLILKRHSAQTSRKSELKQSLQASLARHHVSLACLASFNFAGCNDFLDSEDFLADTPTGNVVLIDQPLAGSEQVSRRSQYIRRDAGKDASMNRIGVYVMLLALMTASGSGCALRRGFVPCCGSCGQGCGGIQGCNDCGVTNDPILGDCGSCGVCGGNSCPGFTPGGFMKYMLTCGSGCSNQIYYGEWISDPPACCDPCDNCGKFTGPVCCRRPGAATIGAMWGSRFPGSCCGGSCGGGCSDGGGYVSNNYAESHSGQHRGVPAANGGPLEEIPPSQPATPTPAMSPRRAAPEPKAMRPTDARGVSYSANQMPRRPGNPYPGTLIPR